MAKDIEIKLNLNEAAVRRLLKQQDGLVGRHLRKRGEIARTAARAQVGKRTGLLAASIYIHQSPTAIGQDMIIGSDHPRALMVHEGTRPHMITPKRGEVLRFSSKGRIVYSRAVKHPGTRPNKYLTDTLPLIVL
jgi:hypothetical protein